MVTLSEIIKANQLVLKEVFVAFGYRRNLNDSRKINHIQKIVFYGEAMNTLYEVQEEQEQVIRNQKKATTLNVFDLDDTLLKISTEAYFGLNASNPLLADERVIPFIKSALKEGERLDEVLMHNDKVISAVCTLNTCPFLVQKTIEYKLNCFLTEPVCIWSNNYFSIDAFSVKFKENDRQAKAPFCIAYIHVTNPNEYERIIKIINDKNAPIKEMIDYLLLKCHLDANAVIRFLDDSQWNVCQATRIKYGSDRKVIGCHVDRSSTIFKFEEKQSEFIDPLANDLEFLKAVQQAKEDIAKTKEVQQKKPVVMKKIPLSYDEIFSSRLFEDSNSNSNSAKNLWG